MDWEEPTLYPHHLLLEEVILVQAHMSVERAHPQMCYSLSFPPPLPRPADTNTHTGIHDTQA